MTLLMTMIFDFQYVKHSYDSAYNSDSNSVAKENQALGKQTKWSIKHEINNYLGFERNIAPMVSKQAVQAQALARSLC